MAANLHLVKTQGIAFASQLLPAIIGVGSFMLLVRHTQPAQLGQYVMYMAAVVLLEMVKSGGLQSAMVMRLSGAGTRQRMATEGSAYYLGFLFSAAISAVLLAVYCTTAIPMAEGIRIFCGWYAVVGLLTVPLHVAEASAVSQQQLSFLFWLRIGQSLNSLVIALYALVKGGTLREYATIHLGITLAILLVVLLCKKTNPLHIRYRTKNELGKLAGLVRYTLGTLAATNLLKSADTFLIGSFLGPQYVAAYAIPLKLTELFEIPLRSLSTTAFPQMAAAHNEGNTKKLHNAFVQYFSWAYLLYVPALLIAIIFAPLVVRIFGGEQYVHMANVFRMFCVYGLLLPADRLTGICLDAMQKPRRNLEKVMIMALVNIVADVAAIYFTGSLLWVAFASVLNVATGVLCGFLFLQQTMVLNTRSLRRDCMGYYLSMFQKRVA